MPAYFWPEFAILFSAAMIGVACITSHTLALSAGAIAKAPSPRRGRACQSLRSLPCNWRRTPYCSRWRQA